ncbi:hypothetical protein EWM64_g9838, partial [Hericium alpestre]
MSATPSATRSPSPQDNVFLFRSSIAAAHSASYLVNPDSKEYESYGEWDAYMAQFKRTYFPQDIQDDLYVAPQQSFTVTLIDDSGDVNKKKKSWRVPDASLRFRKGRKLDLDQFEAQYLDNGLDSMEKFVNAVQSLISWDLADGWIPDVQMDSLLLFIEIKPGASWKEMSENYTAFDDCLDSCYWTFFQNMDDARDQALEQARYFFKNTEDRDSVVAFATAGFKWCWRVFKRNEIGEVERFVDGTVQPPPSNLSYGSSVASAERQGKSSKRRPRVSTDSQP